MRTKPHWLEIVLLLAPFVALAVLWPKLPSQIPIHWGLNGQVDGWSSKTFGALFLPITNIVVYLLALFLPAIDPRMKKHSELSAQSLTALKAVRMAITGLLTLLFFVQMAVALKLPFDSGKLITNGVLVTFLVMGNFFGNLRQNYFIGIRTPWTLENAETWRATHRHCGKILVVGSLILLISQFFVANILPVFVVFVLAVMAWSLWYSWRYSQRIAINSSASIDPSAPQQ